VQISASERWDDPGGVRRPASPLEPDCNRRLPSLTRDEDDSVSRLEVVADAVAAVCETLYQRLQAKLDEDEAPTEFRIEFGITLAGSMGIPVVSQGDTAAAFKVTVKWENG
jgi:hypothetical protein